MELKDISALAASGDSVGEMPVLFVGHGNPMHAIMESEFTRGWQEIGRSLPKASSVLCISAHWETRGTYVTAMEKPRTIHDFGGFPKELYEVQYPAPGDPGLAREAKRVVGKTPVELDHEWGLDHGCWSVLKYLFPNADVPVIQMSLDRTKPPELHYELAKELAAFRAKGVLIVGSGNIVHNLRMADWDNRGGFDWALEANDLLKRLITANEHQALISYKTLGREVQLAVPTPEHYLPLLYVLGLKREDESVSFFNEKAELGSISMLSMRTQVP
jgi:4,5-DOPA dioxygenase extradiol